MFSQLYWYFFMHSSLIHFSPRSTEHSVVLMRIYFGVMSFKCLSTKKKASSEHNHITVKCTLHFQYSNSHMETIKLPSSVTEERCYHYCFPLMCTGLAPYSFTCSLKHTLNSSCPVWLCAVCCSVSSETKALLCLLKRK